MRVARSDVEIAVRGASSTDRTLYLGALLGRAIDGPVIIVGGSAIDVYAGGSEPSLDIDLVTLDTPRAAASRALESWGFSRVGKNWRRQDWEIEIDLRGPAFKGSRAKARQFETPYGTVFVAGPEDLLVKRLAELKHGPTSSSWREALLRQITVLLSAEDLSWDEKYLEFIARRDDVIDLLAGFRAQRA